MAAVLMGGFRPEEARGMPAAAQAAAQGVQYSNTKELGKLLYSHYLFPLQVAAVILLVAIIAAIALTLRRRKDSRHIDPALQVRVRASDRLQIIKLPPTVAAPEPVAPAAVEKQA
jgi:NADH-quinone oxidoreductase subunit J